MKKLLFIGALFLVSAMFACSTPPTIESVTPIAERLCEDSGGIQNITVDDQAFITCVQPPYDEPVSEATAISIIWGRDGDKPVR